MAKRQSRTREARQRRQQQRRRSQRLYVLIAIVVVAVVAVAVFVVSNQPVEAHIPESLSARYEGVQRSYSRDGYPRLGDPNAPVTVEEYSSFACPGCEVFHSESFQDVLDRVKAEQILFTYVPLQTGSVPNAEGAARAALCAGQQGMFWEMHDVLFDWQTRYGNTAFSQNRLLAGVEQLGLSSVAFTSCFNSADITDALNAALNEEVSGTPTIRVNGVTVDGGGAIPTAVTILAAIDDATPDNWARASEDVAPAQATQAQTDELQAQPEADEQESREGEPQTDETASEGIGDQQEDESLATADSNADAPPPTEVPTAEAEG